MTFCPGYSTVGFFFFNAVCVKLKRNTFLNFAVFEISSDVIQWNEQFSCKLYWWEAHETFNCFGCGLWWQMLCCIKLAFLKIFHLHGCHFSLPDFFLNSTHSQCLSIKAGQVGLLSNAVIWCFESACDGLVQKIKSSGLFMQVLSIWVDLLYLCCCEML